jgi:hypothetical protein
VKINLKNQKPTVREKMEEQQQSQVGSLAGESQPKLNEYST